MRKQFLTLSLLGVTALLFTTACGGGTSDKPTEASATTSESSKPAETHYTEKDLVSKDLSADGINATILAPKNAKVIWAADKRQAYLYGGKFFKITIYVKDSVGTAKDGYDMYKSMASNKDANPDFVKMLDDNGTAYLAESKDDRLNFAVYIPRKKGTYSITDGMPLDESPDKFLLYTADDVKTEYASAKSFKEK